jgi:acyl-CoA synthetase (AMP-forming)/AMP-acid ligase II/thioester reductase-like protein/aryl carrier-like protein
MVPKSRICYSIEMPVESFASTYSEVQPEPADLTAVLQYNARNFGASIALRDTNKSLTYQQFWQNSRNLAAKLETAGLQSGDRVALLAERRVETAIAMFGIWAIGGVVVLIDPAWSEVLIDARSASALCRARLDFTDEGEPNLQLENGTRIPALVRIEPLAYIVFTSGSSGCSKGVLVPHRSLVHYGIEFGRTVQREVRKGNFAHVTTFAADLGLTSLVMALVTATTFVILNDVAARDADAFWSECLRHDVGWLKTTPSHFAALMAGRDKMCAPLEGLILGGEKLSTELALEIFETRSADLLINHYGPAEACIGCACKVLRSATDVARDLPSVPIGLSIGANRLILEPVESADGNPDVGQLSIAGPGVTLGYLADNAALSGLESSPAGFFEAAGERRFRTADLCQRLPDGNLLFVKRLDRRVKVNGVLVDLDHVESALRAIPGVGAVSVAAVTQGARTVIHGAIVPAEGSLHLDAGEIRRRFALANPAASFPLRISLHKALPRNNNGKADPGRLTAGADGPSRTAGDGELLGDLLSVCSDLLGTTVGPESDLLALGLDSLTVLMAMVRLRLRGHRVAAESFWSGRSPAAIAAGTLSQPPEPAKSQSPTAPNRIEPDSNCFGESTICNQAVLLRSPSPMDQALIAHSLQRLTEDFPQLLGTADGSGTLLGKSTLAEDRSLAESQIENSCRLLQSSIDPARGPLFLAHLFSGSPNLEDHLLLTAHHSVVDFVSWLLLIETFAEIVLDQQAPASTTYQCQTDGGSATPSQPDFCYPVQGCDYSGPATRQRCFAVPLRSCSHAPSEAHFVEAITASHRRIYPQNLLTIDIEHHGRETPDWLGSTEMGWFTKIEQRTFGSDGQKVEAHLSSQSVPDVVVNFLGKVDLPTLATLGWEIAPLLFSGLRDHGSDALSPLKVTGRVIDECLVVDCIASVVRFDDALLEQFCESLKTELALPLNPSAAETMPSRRLRSSPSGLLFMRRNAAFPAPHSAGTTKQTVVLSGAGGFLGAHLLHELAGRNCDVTAVSFRSPSAGTSFHPKAGQDYYFGGLAGVSAQLRVIHLDLAQPQTAIKELAHLIGEDGATFIHAAADTRLVGRSDAIRLFNEQSTAAMLDLASAVDCRLFHHVSSLAVAGIANNPGAWFDENSFDLGQRFLNEYDRSKFASEAAVRGAAVPMSIQVSRTGHIAGNSHRPLWPRHGRNRVFQMLDAYCRLSMVAGHESEPMVFSHVDTVAAGIVALSLDHRLPGTFHIESPYSLSANQMHAKLAEAGMDMQLVDLQPFVREIDKLAHDDPDFAAIAHWLERPERNWRFARARTIELLDDLGVRFSPPASEWLAALLDPSARSYKIAGPPM